MDSSDDELDAVTTTPAAARKAAKAPASDDNSSVVMVLNSDGNVSARQTRSVRSLKTWLLVAVLLRAQRCQSEARADPGFCGACIPDLARCACCYWVAVACLRS
jgi:hypothetical protein